MSSFSALFPPSRYGSRPLVILDGGMGTTLQSPPFLLPLDSVLWSSELLATREGRDQLVKLHQCWVDAGAEILGSCTYQSSLPLFLPPKVVYTSSEIATARATLTSALPLVTQPFTPSPSFPSRAPPLAALSLGPFGAQLTPAQEYGGLYPPPFGPESPSQLAYSAAAGAACPLPVARVGVTKDSFEDHLAAFHLARLEDFATSPSFPSLALYAFETIPSLREARAIRRAMGQFTQAGSATHLSKPFYISFVFPSLNGIARLPDTETRSLSREMEAEQIVEACFGELEGGEGTPHGLGVNCTDPRRCSEVVQALGKAIGRRGLGERPWLMLYPDGGSVYDPTTRTWSNPDGISESKWAELVADVAASALADESVWGGVIAGGCCKAGPGAIRALRRRCTELALLG